MGKKKCYTYQRSPCGPINVCPIPCPPPPCDPCRPVCPPPCDPCRPICPPYPCPSPCPSPCPPTCYQGWTGATGVGLMYNSNGAVGVGTGISVPPASSKGAVAIGPFAGSAGQAANSIAMGYFSASSSSQPANSFWANMTGTSLAVAYPAYSVSFRTMPTVIPANAGGFYVDAVKPVAAVIANMYYNPITAEISYVP